MKYKIYGERNSGTNYLGQLLSANLEESKEIAGTIPGWIPGINKEWLVDFWFRLTRRKNFGWKHRLPAEVTRFEKVVEKNPDVVFVSIVKNPYWFIKSLHRRPYHNEELTELPLSKFITHEWETLGREGMKKKVLPNPVSLWNLKTKRYLRLAEEFPDRFCVVQYEKLVTQTEAEVSRVLRLIGEPVDPDSLVIPTSPAKRKDVKTLEDYRKEIKAKAWLKGMTEEHIVLINKRLDMEVMEGLGLEPLDVSSSA